jgi:hypothetical protein
MGAWQHEKNLMRRPLVILIEASRHVPDAAGEQGVRGKVIRFVTHRRTGFAAGADSAVVEHGDGVRRRDGMRRVHFGRSIGRSWQDHAWNSAAYAKHCLERPLLRDWNFQDVHTSGPHRQHGKGHCTESPYVSGGPTSHDRRTPDQLRAHHHDAWNASWGGIPSADPNPTEAVGIADLLPDHSIINIPGCPPNP